MKSTMMMVNDHNTCIDLNTQELHIFCNKRWHNLTYLLSLERDRSYHTNEVFKISELDYSISGQILVVPYPDTDQFYFNCLVECIFEIDELIIYEKIIIYGGNPNGT